MINKKTIVFLFVLIILLVLTIAILGNFESISNIVGMDDVKKKPVAFECESSEISEITIETPEKNVVFSKNDVNVWQIADNPNIVLNSEKMNTLLGAIAKVNAYELIEKDSENLENYGLDKPQYKLTAKIGDRIIMFYRGTETPVGDYYYFKTSDSNNVYAQYSKTIRIYFEDSYVME